MSTTSTRLTGLQRERLCELRRRLRSMLDLVERELSEDEPDERRVIDSFAMLDWDDMMRGREH